MPGKSNPGKLILVRHGQSTWNVENLFTGWHDVDLSDQGRLEARSAGVEIKKAGLVPDIAFTSVLKRAIRTLWSVRVAGSRQGTNRGEARRSPGEDLAPEL